MRKPQPLTFSYCFRYEKLACVRKQDQRRLFLTNTQFLSSSGPGFSLNYTEPSWRGIVHVGSIYNTKTWFSDGSVLGNYWLKPFWNDPLPEPCHRSRFAKCFWPCHASTAQGGQILDCIYLRLSDLWVCRVVLFRMSSAQCMATQHQARPAEPTQSPKQFKMKH